MSSNYLYPKETLLGASRTSPWSVLAIGVLTLLALELLGNMLLYVFTGHFFDTSLDFVLLALDLKAAPEAIESPVILLLERTLLIIVSHLLPALILGNMAGGWKQYMGLEARDNWWTWVTAAAVVPLLLFTVGGIEGLMTEYGYTDWIQQAFIQLEPRRLIVATAYVKVYNEYPLLAFLTTVALAITIGLFYMGFLCGTIQKAMGSTLGSALAAGFLMAALRLHPSKFPLLLVCYIVAAWLRFRSHGSWPTLLLYLLVTMGTALLQLLEVDPIELATTHMRSLLMVTAGLASVGGVLWWHERQHKRAAAAQ